MVIDAKIKALDDQIQKIKEKEKQLKAQKQAALARLKTKEVTDKRKAENRMKILLGAFLLKKIESDEVAKNNLNNELDKYLTRDDDRSLFGLSPIEKPEVTKNAPTL
jgi:hypothetical protein